MSGSSPRIDGGVTWAVEIPGFAKVITEALAINTSGAKQLFAFHARTRRMARGPKHKCLSRHHHSANDAAQWRAQHKLQSKLDGKRRHDAAYLQSQRGRIAARADALDNWRAGGAHRPRRAVSPFAVRATDTSGCLGTRVFTLQIACQAITLNPTTLPQAAVGTAYSQQLTAAGGIGSRELRIIQHDVASGADPFANRFTVGRTYGCRCFRLYRSGNRFEWLHWRSHLLSCNNWRRTQPCAGAGEYDCDGCGSRFARLQSTSGGANFINGSVVRWNGADRVTSFVSSAVSTSRHPSD
jgi:hypothetical protein